jgi:hypothetical protein
LSSQQGIIATQKSVPDVVKHCALLTDEVASSRHSHSRGTFLRLEGVPGKWVYLFVEFSIFVFF